MRQYSEEKKASVLSKLLPPYNKTYRELSREEGIPAPTIYTWIKKNNQVGIMSFKSVKTSVSWSVEARFLTLVETATMNETELGEYCREKGLYPEQLRRWKNECIAGLTERPVIQEEKSQGKGDKKRISQLEKELRRKEKALAEAAALLILGKKLQAFYEEGSEDA